MVLFWTSGKTSATLGAGFLYGIGVTDGTTSGAIATSSDDGKNPSAAHRRIASKALTIVNGAGTVLAEADFQSSDATNSTLDWTTNNATGYVIHFAAIGGSDVSAKVVTWAMPLATGNQAVTGVGFQPDVVLHLNPGVLVSTIPSTVQHGASGLGVMDGTGAQWTTFQGSVDAATTSDTQRYQRSIKTLGVIINDLSVAKEATWVSMDSGGFTMNFATANSLDNQVVSLALKGVRTAVGCFTKTVVAAPAAQSISGLGLHPRLVLLASAQNTASTTGVSQARFGIGASDGITAGASAFQDADGLATTSSDGVDKTTKAFIKLNNDTQTIDAEASMTSLDPTGFTLDWTTNDAVATEICYLALAPRRRVVVFGTRTLRKAFAHRGVERRA